MAGGGGAHGVQVSSLRRQRAAERRRAADRCRAAAAACVTAGQGGTGDTWQFKDLSSGRDVAVKFIKRPLPKVLQTNILREFTVSQRQRGWVGVLSVAVAGLSW